MKWAALLFAALVGDVLSPALPRDFFQSGALLPGATSGATAAPPSAVAIDALPYTRTLVCDSFVLTGTSSGADSIAWSASPSGDSGACSGTGTWSCTVLVEPTSAAEAVETITITATSGGGSITDTVPLAFLPGNAYACWLAQDPDGSYGATLSNAGTLSTLEDGVGDLDLAQGSAGARPTWFSELVGTNGQPLISCDGNDHLVAADATDWNLLHEAGSERTVVVGVISRAGDPGVNGTIVTNKTNTDAARGWHLLSMDSGINDSARQQIGDGSSGVLVTNLGADTVISGKLNLLVDVLDDDGAGGDDGFLYANGLSTASAAATGALSALAAGSPMTLCDRGGGGGSALTGLLSHVVVYDRVLTSGEIDAADAAVSYVLGQTAPASLPIVGHRADLGITLNGSSVTAWASRGTNVAPQPLASCTAGTTCPLIDGSGVTLGVVFDSSNDIMSSASPVGFTTSSGHAIVVATITDVTSNNTAADCWNNDRLWTGTGYTFALMARTGGGSPKIIAQNFDGSHDCAETDMVLNERAVYEWRHVGGQLGVAVNGGAFVEVASGATGGAGVGTWAIGAIGGANFIGAKIHEVLNYYNAIPDTQRAEIVAGVMADWGITP